MENFDLDKCKTLEEYTKEMLDRVKEALKNQTLHENCVTLSKKDVEWMVYELERKSKGGFIGTLGIAEHAIRIFQRDSIVPDLMVIGVEIEREAEKDKKLKEINEFFSKIWNPKILDCSFEEAKRNDEEKSFRNQSPFYGGNGKRIKKNNFYKGKKVK